MENKEQVLQKCITVGNEYGYISWDGLLDECDEDMMLVDYVQKHLTDLKNEGKIEFELDF